MSIYEYVLGDDFKRLHPMLQHRYAFTDNRPASAHGTMNYIRGVPLIAAPFSRLYKGKKLLFSERGHDVPFTIINTPAKGKNQEQQVHWERIFYFPEGPRYFNALMSLDSRRSVIQDYLGEPALLYSDLHLSVAENGGLAIRSSGQKLILGKTSIPLPRLLQADAAVLENYDDSISKYCIDVHVANPLIGTLFLYKGVFALD